MSFGGGPSAFTSSLIGWASAMSTCGLAPSWVQPRRPARLTAATTSRQWLKAKIGRSMPNMSQTRVRTFLSSGVASGDLGGPAIVGLSARRAHDAVDDVELPGNLVTSNLRTAVLLD